MRIGRATWRQYWNADAPGVLGRLPPLPPEAVEGRGDDQDHQRKLEVHVDDLEARLRREQARRQLDPDVPQEDGEEPKVAEREDEGERERDAGEVRGDAGERQQGRPQEPWQPADDHRCGQQESEDPTADRGDEADLDAVGEGVGNDAGRQVGVIA